MKRWPVIRHVRFLWTSMWFRIWAEGPLSENDVRYLNDIWDGKI